MIIKQNRIIAAIIASLVLSAAILLAYTLLPSDASATLMHLICATCGLAALLAWGLCFFLPDRESRFASKRGWAGSADFSGTRVTEEYKPAPVAVDDNKTINLVNKPVKVIFTHSDGKTESKLTLDPKDIRRRGGYTIGSAANCDFPLDDRTIAPRHIRLYTEGHILCIQNLGNNNGVKANGQHLNDGESAPFPRKGIVYLGGARLEFRG